MRARGKSKWKNLYVQIDHNILLLFCFLLILERGSILREKKILARKSTFGILSLQLCTYAEKGSYKGKIQKVDYRGTLFLFFHFSENRSALRDEQKTKKKQNVMIYLHVKSLPIIFASSSHNLKKMFWDFFENFMFLKFLYKTAIILKGLEFQNILLLEE